MNKIEEPSNYIMRVLRNSRTMNGDKLLNREKLIYNIYRNIFPTFRLFYVSLYSIL